MKSTQPTTIPAIAVGSKPGSALCGVTLSWPFVDPVDCDGEGERSAGGAPPRGDGGGDDDGVDGDGVGDGGTFCVLMLTTWAKV
jgi:hypothetical protein